MLGCLRIYPVPSMEAKYFVYGRKIKYSATLEVTHV